MSLVPGGLSTHLSTIGTGDHAPSQKSLLHVVGERVELTEPLELLRVVRTFRLLEDALQRPQLRRQKLLLVRNKFL